MIFFVDLHQVVRLADWFLIACYSFVQLLLLDHLRHHWRLLLIQVLPKALVSVISKLIYLSFGGSHLQFIPIARIGSPLDGFKSDLLESIDVDGGRVVIYSFLVSLFLVVVLVKYSLLLLLFVICFHLFIIFQALYYILLLLISQILWAVIWVIHRLVLIWKFLIDDLQLHLFSQHIFRLFSLFYCLLHCKNLIAEIWWIKRGCTFKSKLRLFYQMLGIW